jgi:hypothetical protein
MSFAMKKKVLVLCYSDLSRDPRLRRQVLWIKDEFEVSVAGIKHFDDVPVRFLPITPQKSIDKFKKKKNYQKILTFHHNYPFLFRKMISLCIKLFLGLRNSFSVFKTDEQKFENEYWYGDTWHGRYPDERVDFIESLNNEFFDVIIANDIDTVPLALKIGKGKSKIIFDSHEFHPGESDENLDWVREQKSLVTYLCKTYIPKVDLMFTVGHCIADLYEKEFNRKPLVITNASGYRDNLKPGTVGPEIKLIHHGLCVRGRDINAMLQMTKFLDKRFQMDLMLMPVEWDLKYYEEIKEIASQLTNVKIIPPVPTVKISEFINAYDVGIYIIQPSNLNNLNSLPNKFFEFIQARLAIAIAPSPEMKKIVENHRIGIVSKDFTSQALAECLNSLTNEEISAFKQETNSHAYELSSEKNKELFLAEVKKML